ncbi:MAG: alpha-L-fucosidase [Kiritimatiellae bacterium]|nr:alpha-L-fucosidase [Kiritimatiellia bacterium]
MINRTLKAPAQAIRRFVENRYGMFIHFGLYSVYGRHEWAMCYERIPKAQYRQVAKRFKPREGCAREWVKLAKSVGMRYACLTTRHCEGYSLFDSPANPFNAVRTGPRRDLVREFVEACRENGIRPCLYYSVADWGDPGFVAGPKDDPKGWKRFIGVVHAELKTLMTNYGEIDYLFYDACPPDPKVWGVAELNAEIRHLQPNILISDRCCLNEDVASAEQHTMSSPGKPWECCLTMNESWGYNSTDEDWKTPRELVKTLLICIHNDGNLLLNVGPQADGTVPARSVRDLKAAWRWISRNKELVYGTKGNPFNYADQKLSAYRGHTAYVPLHFYHGPDTVVAGIGNKVRSARVLGAGQAVRFRQKNGRVSLIGLPARMPDKPFTVIALELDGPPHGIPHPLLGQGRAKYD